MSSGMLNIGFGGLAFLSFLSFTNAPGKAFLSKSM